MASPKQLESWITSSRDNLRMLRIGLLVCAGLALLVSLANRTAGMMMFGLVALVGLGGSWIIGSHIADWESQLRRRGHSASRVG